MSTVLNNNGVVKTLDNGTILNSVFSNITESSATTNASLKEKGVVKKIDANNTIGSIFYESSSTSDNTEATDKTLLDSTGVLVKKANKGATLSQVYYSFVKINDIIDTRAFDNAAYDPNLDPGDYEELNSSKFATVAGAYSDYDDDGTSLYTSGNFALKPIVGIGKDYYGIFLQPIDYGYNGIYGDTLPPETDIYYYEGNNRWRLEDSSGGIFIFEPTIPIIKDETLIPTNYSGIFYSTKDVWNREVTKIPGVIY